MRVVRRPVMGLLVVGGLVAAIVVAVSLVRGPDLSADETERALREGMANVADFDCRRMWLSYWDYDCSFTSIIDGERVSIGVRVDGGVLDHEAP